ncbi:MAG: fumarylacetoacetate hydrolase family protein, partial [Phycisphaerae bacterium]|nr:fumarylacetoacetate hydrolase family protein [Phycisphaerae bacterium]
VCVGLNYRDHAEETGMAVPDEPVLFMKPTTASLAPGQPILRPPDVGRVDYEAELAMVVKDRCRCVRPEDADSHILGYTCFNDVTARDLQTKDGQWTRAKGFDTFAPFGPWIETAAGNPDALEIQLRLNGEVKQSSSTSQLIFSCRYLLSFVSRVMTLEAGDVIATGTPAGIGPIQVGDVVEVAISGIGSLINPVAEPELEPQKEDGK